MQVKTISKVCRAKMTDWLATIKDEKLRKKVSENLLISGGSIASMFLGEDVNDYDVYIKDIDVLKELVEHYTKPFPIEILDGRNKKDIEADFLTDSGRSVEKSNSHYAIAIRNLKEDQIKLHFTDAGGGMPVNQETAKEELLYDPLFFSPNAISLSNDVQIVVRFHGDSEQIHKTFDFIHATNYFTMEDGLVTNKEALESLITKRLVYQGSHYPVTSIIRMRKFINRKWGIGAGEILKIAFQVSDLDLRNPDVLEEQLIGVDVAYFNTLISILRGVPEDKAKNMSYSYLNKLIDRVFGDEESNNEINES